MIAVYTTMRTKDRDVHAQTHIQTHTPWVVAISASVSDSCQNISLSAHCCKLGCDWLVLDLSASTHATLELSGSLENFRSLLNFPVSSPLCVCVCMCVCSYIIKLYNYTYSVMLLCNVLQYPFKGLHGRQAMPSLLHTSMISHSVDRHSRLY